MDDALRAVEDGAGGATAGPLGAWSVGAVSTSLDAVRSTFEEGRSLLHRDGRRDG